jgi:hypothetical protein
MNWKEIKSKKCNNSHGDADKETVHKQEWEKKIKQNVILEENNFYYKSKSSEYGSFDVGNSSAEKNGIYQLYRYYLLLRINWKWSQDRLEAWEIAIYVMSYRCNCYFAVIALHAGHENQFYITNTSFQSIKLSGLTKYSHETLRNKRNSFIRSNIFGRFIYL